MEPGYYKKNEEIISCYKNIRKRGGYMPEITSMLIDRREELDKNFVWTDDAICRLKAVNEKAQECLDHFKPIQEKLPKWLENHCSDDRSEFLNDFELDYVISPVVRWTDENGDEHEDEGIYEALHDHIPPKIFLSFSYGGFEDNMFYKEDDKDGYRIYTRPLNIDRLKGVHINYVIHVLSDHLEWSIQDILNISEFWGEVIVRGQHFAEIDL